MAKPQQTKRKEKNAKNSGDKRDNSHSGIADHDGAGYFVVMTIQTWVTKEGRGAKEGGDEETNKATKEADVEVKEASCVGPFTVVIEK